MVAPKTPLLLGPPDEDWISSLDSWIQSLAMGSVSNPALVVTADIITMDPGRPRVAAVGIVDGRVVATGTRGEALAACPPGTAELALPGTVVPGLIDSHVHMLWGGR